MNWLWTDTKIGAYYYPLRAIGFAVGVGMTVCVLAVVALTAAVDHL